MADWSDHPAEYDSPDIFPSISERVQEAYLFYVTPEYFISGKIPSRAQAREVFDWAVSSPPALSTAVKDRITNSNGWWITRILQNMTRAYTAYHATRDQESSRSSSPPTPPPTPTGSTPVPAPAPTGSTPVPTPAPPTTRPPTTQPPTTRPPTTQPPTTRPPTTQPPTTQPPTTQPPTTPAPTRGPTSELYGDITRAGGDVLGNLKKVYTNASQKLFGDQNMFKDDMKIQEEYGANIRSTLRPFLPIAGEDAMDEQDDEESDRLKEQNLLMGQFKSPNWPLGNVDNPFWIGNKINEGMRFSDPLFAMPAVYNGGTLQEGATLFGSYRSPPMNIPPSHPPIERGYGRRR